MKSKPRNHVVLAMLKSHKSSGTHGKSKKAQTTRQDRPTQIKTGIKKGPYNGAFSFSAYTLISTFTLTPCFSFSI